MPTYSYECKKCAHVQEEFHAMSATPRVKCEECGGDMRRLLGTGSGVIFKGSGFYETDYKRNGSSKSGNGAAKSESKSETKTESAGSKSAGSSTKKD